MEKGENFDDIFDLIKPNFPEIYSTKPQVCDNNEPPISWKSSSSLISFENSDHYKSDINVEMSSDYSGILKFSSDDDEKKKVNSAAARTPSQALDHVMAERKRRQNLSQLFISLSKLVPGLKKLDKASLLEDGIKYLKSLQERERVLEEEDEMRRRDLQGSSDCCPEIEARISDKHVLIKIFCKKEMGLMSRINIPFEILMEKMHLNVVDMRLMPFGGTALYITILAQMQRDFVDTAKDVVDHLHTLF